jgi:hypothetical protein
LSPEQLSGSSVDVTEAQVPGLVVVLHAWHVPQVAVSQQTPSTHAPVSQSPPLPHAAPWV